MFSFLIVFAVTLLFMEIFAYATHRWLMHGPGWFLHESHHLPRNGHFELNDLYAAIFAMPSILLIYLGIHGDLGELALAAGLGVAAYGLIYFVFHDILVHGRLPNRYVSKGKYMKRIIQAHKLHHAVQSKNGTVSFGFLYAPPIRNLKKSLRGQGILSQK